jgi:GH35 family endo-1,4-beta-xylanase/peptidoglycan/xylan/chitin deacetylase (PgdA/CDA1 family)
MKNMGRILIMALVLGGGCASREGQGGYQSQVPEMTIAISFDDGPSEKTEQLLAVLRENNVKATFFLVGQLVENNPEKTRRIFAEGHEIGNHSYGFEGLGKNGKADEAAIRESLRATSAIIKETTGKAPVYFRAPNLDYSDTLSGAVKDMGMSLIGAGVSGRDWEADISTEEIISNILEAAKDGGIILLHERHSGDTERTIRAVPVIVHELRLRGYEIVSVGELAKKKGVSLEAGIRYDSIGEAKAMNGRADNTPPLKESYINQFLIGNVMSPGETGTPRFEILSRHFNIITAENAMKPSSLQREKGIFTFEPADRMVDAVLAQGLKMHGHTLAWHQQSPDWMNYEGISRSEAMENLSAHVKTVAAHFKGRVISWDVLNEAIIDNPPEPGDWRASLRQSPWYKAIGPDYVEFVFQAAREADPEAKLYYNDYNLDNQNKALAVYNMVRELNEKNPDAGGRPLIDGVGMQGHYRLNTNMDNVRLSMERFISLGVELSITELDIQAGSDSKQTDRQLVEQGVVYAGLFSLFREYAAHIGRVSIWGLDDGASWRSVASPCLFDRELRAKPAFYAALNPVSFIAENRIKLIREAKQGEAPYGTPVIGPNPDPLWNNVPALPVDQYLMAWQGASGTVKALWDEKNLYVLVQVHQAELNKASPNAYEQDSVEVFIDEDNQKTSFFRKDDGQYRVNFDNETSFNPPSAGTGFVSAAAAHEKSYTVTMKIPFKTIVPAADSLVGFDVQINGASAQGIRQSIAVWNDTTGNSFQDTSGYGVLKLVKK